MNCIDELLEAIARSRRSAREISIAAVGHASAVRNLKQRRDIRASTLEALCRELDLEFYVGPGRAVPSEIAKALKLPEDCSVQDVVRMIQFLDRWESRVTRALSKAEARSAEEDERSALRSLEIENMLAGVQEAPEKHYRWSYESIPFALAVDLDRSSGELVFKPSGREISIRRYAIDQWVDLSALIAIPLGDEPRPPDLLDEDLVLLDISKVEPVDRGLFLTHSPDGIAYIRTELIARTWILPPRRPGDLPRSLKRDTRFAGRVAWHGSLNSPFVKSPIGDESPPRRPLGTD